MSYLAMAMRRQHLARARNLLQAALKDAPCHAVAPPADMLINGEGGAKDEKRALSLLTGRLASDVAAVAAALGRLMIEGRLMHRNVAEGIQLLRRDAVSSLETQMEVMRHRRANPDVSIHRPNDFPYDALEAAELDEPGMPAVIIDLKLSDSIQLKDRDGACRLIDTYAKEGREVAVSRRQTCQG
jgi:hypothetical protein